MGVYHLMGLGRSPGTVIGALTYLAHSYNWWMEHDFERNRILTACNLQILCFWN